VRKGNAIIKNILSEALAIRPYNSLSPEDTVSITPAPVEKKRKKKRKLSN